MDAVWQESGAGVELREGTVQVWRVPVDAACAGLLNGEERARAARVRAGSARDEFVAARGALRLLLGGVLGVAGEGLRFALGAQGKPRLEGGGDVEFNVSHSGGCVLVALSRAGAVGVDVEPLDRAAEALELARAHFHPEEVARIEGAGDRPGEFFRCWTRKEAAVKADGRGLQVPLEGFSVVGELPLAVELPGGGAVWLREVPVGDGFAGALALRVGDARVEWWHLQGGNKSDVTNRAEQRGY